LGVELEYLAYSMYPIGNTYEVYMPMIAIARMALNAVVLPT